MKRVLATLFLMSMGLSLLLSYPKVSPSGLSLQFRNDGLGFIKTNFFLPQNLATSPTSLAFGNVIVGQSSTPLVISLASDTEVQLTGIALGGANPKDFSYTTNCPVDILPTKGCSITVVFTPSAIGPRTATLTAGFIGAPNAPTNLNITIFAGRKQDKNEQMI